MNKTIVAYAVILPILMLGLVFGISYAFTAMTNKPVNADNLTKNARQTKVLGGNQAEEPVLTVVEFSDLQCPACKAVQPLIKQVGEKYPGKVRIAFRHFPLISIHKNAFRAAVAAEVAASQNKFWEFHDVLFEKQQDWEALSGDQLDVAFAEYAESVGLNKDQFLQELRNNTAIYAEKVQQDSRDANALGVDATPTFYIDGYKVINENLLQAIEKKLKS